MTRRIIAVLTLALALAACGGETADTTAADTEPPAAPATTEAPATTAAPTTTVAETTTTTVAETTTTTEGIDPLVAAATELAGSYEGEWVNTTFGSSGPITGTLSADEGAPIGIVVDLGGFVFGESDPDEEAISLPLAGVSEVTTFESATFGTIEVTVTDTGVSLVAADVPSPSIGSFTLEAAETDTGVAGTYEIVFEGDTVVGAEGTFFLDRVDG